MSNTGASEASHSICGCKRSSSGIVASMPSESNLPSPEMRSSMARRTRSMFSCDIGPRSIPQAGNSDALPGLPAEPEPGKCVGDLNDLLAIGIGVIRPPGGEAGERGLQEFRQHLLVPSLTAVLQVLAAEQQGNGCTRALLD